MKSMSSSASGFGVGVGVVVLIMMQCALINGIDESIARAVPAMFIFGDSTVDNGNNNNLYTIGRANFPPYGRDFDSRHATGRFSNGRVATDFVGLPPAPGELVVSTIRIFKLAGDTLIHTYLAFLAHDDIPAEFLRLPLVVPYLSPEATMDIYHGANFASAGAGILNRTGDVLGQKISHWQQIELFLERRVLLLQVMGEVPTKQYLSNSIFYLAIGGNDFIHNYITKDTDDALLTSDQFIELLLSSLKLQVQALFDAGARKIVLLGTGPVGCLPHFLFASNSTTGECVSDLNELISTYNARLAKMAYDFIQDNPGSNVIYRDIFDIVLQMTANPQAFGFTMGNTACCGAGPYGGAERCLTPAMACEHPSDYVWWDEYHPSHKASDYIASQIWSGTDPPIKVSDGLSSAYNISFMTLQELALLDLDSE